MSQRWIDAAARDAQAPCAEGRAFRDIEADARARVADRHDVRPATPDQSAHIRQVPGNHREELDDTHRAPFGRIVARLIEMFGCAQSPFRSPCARQRLQAFAVAGIFTRSDDSI